MTELPNGYRRTANVNILTSRAMSTLSVLLLGGMLALGFGLAPRERPKMSGGETVGWLIGLFAAIALYMLLHELVHGAFMRGFSHVKPRYRFRGAYAAAGSDAFFTRKQYVTVALMPLLLLGAGLLLINAVLYPRLFWFVYIVQMLNVSGSAGDLYISARILKMPRMTLVQDTGTEMRFFTR